MNWLSWEKQKALRPMSFSVRTCLLLPVQSVVLIGSVTLPLLSLLNLPAPLALSGNCQREEIWLCHLSGGMKCRIYKTFLRTSFFDLPHFSHTVLKSLLWLCKSWNAVWLQQLSAHQCFLWGKWWVIVRFMWQIRAFSQSGSGQIVVKEKHCVIVGGCYSCVFLRSFNFPSNVCNFNLKQYLLVFYASIYIVCFEFNPSNFKMVTVIASTKPAYLRDSPVLSFAMLYSNKWLLETGWEQQLCKLFCHLKLCSDLVCLSYENGLAFYPIPLRTCVHILQSARDKHKTGTLVSWWETPVIWTAGILQVHVICINVTVYGTCIISAVNGLTSQALMVNEPCFWDRDSERDMTMITCSWKCYKT